MRVSEKVHAYHRFWRYRLRTERNEIAFLMGQRLTGSTLVDVGAHRGAYSYWMHRAAGPAGRVVAFEPQSELVEYLHRVKRGFRLDRLDIVAAGASDRPGQLPLVRPRNHWGGASFHLGAETYAADVIRTPVTTLDDYFASRDLPPVRFIKCDVQDHEAHVFRGATGLLAAQRPTLLFEQTEACIRSGEAASLLAELGYHGYFFHERKLVSTRELPRLRWRLPAPHLNYVYYPAEQSRQLRIAC